MPGYYRMITSVKCRCGKKIPFEDVIGVNSTRCGTVGKEKLKMVYIPFPLELLCDCVCVYAEKLIYDPLFELEFRAERHNFFSSFCVTQLRTQRIFSYPLNILFYFGRYVC